MRTTYGSPLFADHVPQHDSLLVERLRAAGAIVIGKTNTPEFGAGSQTFNAVFGVTRNPYDLARTPGGSSGGAAAAVAAGMLPLADGSDLGASVRNPAAFCNLVGLRPSPAGSPSLAGDAWNPLPVLGPIARTVEDLALLLQALGRPDPRDPLSRPARGLRADLDGDLARAADRVEPRPRRAARRAGHHRRARGAAGDARGAGVRGGGRRAGLRRSRRGFETLRGVDFATFAELVEQVKPDTGREHPPRAGAHRPQIGRALTLRSEIFTRMASSSSATTCSPRRSPRWRRSRSRSSGRTRWPVPRWAPTSSGFAPARGSRSPATRDVRARGLHGRWAARRAAARRPPPRRARPAAAGRAPTPTRPGSRSAGRTALADDAADRGPPRRVRRRRAAPVLARRRSRRAPALDGAVIDADLCIVGGGFTGLWAALHAKADDPARDVVVLEAETAGFGASGRNGGFGVASLTHGLENGLARFAEEMAALERLGLENFAGLRADLERHGIDCDFEPTGELTALTEPTRARVAGGGGERAARASATRSTVFDGAGDARRDRLAHLRRRHLGPHRRRRPRPRQAGAGPARRRRCGAGVRLYEHSRRDALRDAGPVVGSRRPRRASAPAASCWPPAPTRRCCARSAATSCRSTTTCW